MPSIFISYRRSDTDSAVGRIYDKLAKNFSRKAIFRDCFSIESGEIFPRQIAEAISNSTVILIVIGKTWSLRSSISDGADAQQPEDYVRWEIEQALQHPNAVVIPLLVESSQIPTPESLPESIRPLLKRNAHLIRPDPHFNADLTSLCHVIEKYVRPTAKLQRRAVFGLCVSLLCAVIACFCLILLSPLPFIKFVDATTNQEIRSAKLFGVVLETGMKLPAERRPKLPLSFWSLPDVIDVTVDDISIKTTAEDQLPNTADQPFFFNPAIQNPQIRFAFLPRERTVLLQRSRAFLSHIQPDLSKLADLPSYRTIRQELEKTTKKPWDVTLIVKNKTSRSIDFILQWYPPFETTDADPFRGPQSISAGTGLEHDQPIAPNCSLTVPLGDICRFEEGYFLFLVSAGGELAQLAGKGNLYQDNYAIVEVTSTESADSYKFKASLDCLPEIN